MSFFHAVDQLACVIKRKNMANQNKGLKLRQIFVFGTNFLIYLILFLLFLGLFGISSIKKYLDKKTIIVTYEEQTNGIMAPAITLSATKQSIFGWKTLNQSSIGETVIVFLVGGRAMFAPRCYGEVLKGEPEVPRGNLKFQMRI